MTINEFITDSNGENVDIRLTVVEEKDNHVVAKVTMWFEKKTVPQPIKIMWKIPVGNILSVWSPLIGFTRFIAPNWRRTKCESKTAVGAPVMSLVNHDGTNACTIAISDPKTPIEIGAGASEEEAMFFCNTTFFTSYICPIDYYEAYIRIDFDAVPFTESVKRANEWWENDFGYRKAYVPKEAYLPMDSSWYSFHQGLDSEKLLEECKLSAKLGMKTLIIDDGWQTDDNNRGYKFCGDWELATKKIPCMKSLVDRIHALGMKVMLWFSVPYVGPCSKIYEKFKDMALKREKGVLVVDIRYKEVRDYLVNIYIKTVKDFGLDGLKLDFIDHFTLEADSPEVNDRMDIPSVEDALENLLCETKQKLLEINPEILLEFRQGYIGPTVLKYGNMIRVGDCPYDSMRNRAGIINLRLTSGNTAVHSDMIMWSKDAPIEAVARQLISTLYGVPQVSLLLNELPQQHIDAIRFWLDFYIKNIEILHSSELYVKNPELGYSQVKTCKNGTMIGVNYADVPFELKAFQNNDAKYVLINSSNVKHIVVDCSENIVDCCVKIYSCLGEMVSEVQSSLQKGIQKIEVPVCGFVEITRC